MRLARGPALPVLLLLMPSVAHAHSPVPGIGSFYGGTLHPVLVLPHLLLLLALGLRVGQEGLRHIELALPTFAAGLAGGLLCTGLGYVSPLPPSLLLAPAALLGLWTASAWSLPREATGVAATAAGLLIGLDSLPEAGSARELVFTLFGTALGAGLVVVHIVVLAERFQRPWQRIGVRILGSWICAISVMVLALALAPRTPAALP